MKIKLFTNIIKQFRDSKFRLIFEKSIFTFLYGFTKVGQYRAPTHAGRILAIHVTAVLQTLEINCSLELSVSN